jgi:hypothetical protein
MVLALALFLLQPDGLAVRAELSTQPLGAGTRSELDALLSHAFLDLPHERLLETGRNTIELRVVGQLAKDAALEFNVLTYALPRTGADFRREQTRRYDRLTTYLVDAKGRVLEIFPTHRRMWMPWDAVLHRIDELRR